MAGPLLSTSWYRVAGRKPKLRSHARLFRHRYRDQVWHLLQDPASARVHRFSASARFVIALMNGRRSVAEMWELANRRLGDDAPTQDEMITLLGQLHAANLLQTDMTPDVGELFARGEREDRARNLRSFANPMAIRVSLWDPNRFLNRFAPLVRFLWSRWGAAIWLAVVLPALLLVPPHWSELTNNFVDRVLAFDKLFLLYLTFPLVKALHEFGHATAVKAGGGEVHDMGMILLVLLPVPYVEASAATVFKSKYQRALVGAAGVGAEIFLAALAYYAWLLVEPGIVKAALFHVMLIASVSTLVFNGNPLLRYDAYYVLADLIEIPNLASRSTQYWRYLLNRYLVGLSDEDPPAGTPSEKKWFLFYGVASAIYRILVTVAIALFIAGRFFIVGVLLALWALVAMAVVPIVRVARHLLTDPRVAKRRRRLSFVASMLLLFLGGGLFVIPAPSHTNAEGVVWVNEDSIVRAEGNGFLRGFLVGSGKMVKPDEPIARLNDAAITAKFQIEQARVAELQAQYTAQFVSDRGKAQVIRDRLESERASLALARERVQDLIMRTRSSGTFVAAQMDDMPGRYFKKGDLIGYVIGNSKPVVRIVVPQDAVERVRNSAVAVQAKLVDRPDVTYRARVIREVPEGERYLPSRALAVEGGGEIATDPRDAKGPKALERMFQFDLELDGFDTVDHFGQRVFVRIEHPPQPLAFQWYRAIRLLFLSAFNV
jgi:putative peptide zinc metalloprotease protein